MPRDLAGAELDVTTYGFKAHYLGTLSQLGFLVPPGFALSQNENVAALDIDPSIAYAVRSSGAEEDTLDQSFAGSFTSEIGVRGLDEITRAVESVRSGRIVPTGVIVQHLIDAEYAGVAFSIDPATYGTETHAISWVPGLGGALVAGEVAGTSVVVARSDGRILHGAWCSTEEILGELSRGLDVLAERLAGPVDVEWCIERVTGRLFLLQVRPIVLPHAGQFDISDLTSLRALPAVALGHPKIQLRRDALEAGVTMTPAVALVGTAREIPTPVPTDRSETAAGSSVVLLHPFRVGERVIREFSNVNELDVADFAASCRRYSIRQYPSFDGIAATQRRVLAQGLDHAAVSIILEQEIWNAWSTGIVRKLDNGFIIEVALGHFVPKGYVDTSTYFVDDHMRVVSRHEVLQRVAYHFMNGHVITEEYPEDLPQLSDEQIVRVLTSMAPLLERDPSVAFEFGYTRRDSDGAVYLIDSAESDAPDVSLSASSFQDGVVSHGVAEGAVVDLRKRKRQDDLNAHLHQRVTGRAPAQPTIFIASRASVDLLDLLYGCPPGCGFVFEEASLLAHFAVVLRERGVAGVVRPRDEIATLSRSATARINTRGTPMVRAALEKDMG